MPQEQSDLKDVAKVKGLLGQGQHMLFNKISPEVHDLKVEWHGKNACIECRAIMLDIYARFTYCKSNIWLTKAIHAPSTTPLPDTRNHLLVAR